MVNDRSPHPVPSWAELLKEKDAEIAKLKRRIEQLEAEAKTRTLDYLGQVGQLSEEITRLRAAMTEAASLASSGAPYINNTIYAVLWAALEERT